MYELAKPLNDEQGGGMYAYHYFDGFINETSLDDCVQFRSRYWGGRLAVLPDLRIEGNSIYDLTIKQLMHALWDPEEDCFKSLHINGEGLSAELVIQYFIAFHWCRNR